jgi:hypothetical protein
LDEILIPAGHVCSRRHQALLLDIAIDEVHPLAFQPSELAPEKPKTSDVPYPKRVPPKSLP